MIHIARPQGNTNPERLKSPRRRFTWIGIIVVVSVALGLAFWYYRPPVWRNQPTIIYDSKPLPVSSRDCDLETPVADSRVVAEIICTALNHYYDERNEYPPYLFGGAIALNDTDARTNTEIVHNPDPLLTSGFLGQYPLAVRFTSNPITLEQVGSWYDSRGSLLTNTEYWVCMYSTPDDWKLLDDMKTIMRYFSNSEQAGSRLFALRGARAGRWYGDPYSLFGDDRERMLRQKYCKYGGDPTRTKPNFPFFGYQRGEWFGSDEQACWIWFYGSNLWPERRDKEVIVRNELNLSDEWLPMYGLWHDFGEAPYGLLGLDLIDDATCELKPDGIPDGICLLYKLEKGEIVSVTRAEGV